MIHPASHCPLLVLSRSDGRSAVAAGAYIARTRMTDQRTGLTYNYRNTQGLLAEGMTNWAGSPEQLWNAAERSEKRMNSRVARELRPALPAELPLNEQRRLVHGFACWLKDEFGVAVHWVIHAPNFHDKQQGKRMSQARKCREGEKNYLAALFDPARTNLNFHGHIRFTTRRVVDGDFLEKTRELDSKQTGSECVVKIRDEWQRRTNAALARLGSEARIDLRSYETMSAEGDAPAGLQAQHHAGPKRTARSRATLDENVAGVPDFSAQRDAARNANEKKWICWLEIRHLERERMRLLAAAELAEARERARKERALKEKKRIAEAKSAEEQRRAIEAATTIDQVSVGDDMLAAALHWAQSGAEAPSTSQDSIKRPHELGDPDHCGTSQGKDEFDEEIDPETYNLPSEETPLIKRQRIKKPTAHVRSQRVRG
ncbi:conjugal transfer protein [Sulfitobacter sp. M39]|uniref:MobA/MobL family protein n=1 Tax=Sulfitobacter sp. M39 TaxID=2675334 RepID=UPI001F902292|nr:MobA/MobL family protein [Sulfitobacter sp. M39]MCF7748509.1 conjugal transfer protein [Sulfitobacter sp. M39]